MSRPAEMDTLLDILLTEPDMLLRCGQYPSGASTPAAVLLRPGQEDDPTRLASLGVRETLNGPHTVRHVLDLIAGLV